MPTPSDKEEVEYRSWLKEVRTNRDSTYKRLLDLTPAQENFAFNFHTYLRKGMDNSAAILCWNAIDLMKGDDHNDWLFFVRAMWNKDITKRNCMRYSPCGMTSQFNILHIGFEMMDDQVFEYFDKFMKGL